MSVSLSRQMHRKLKLARTDSDTSAVERFGNSDIGVVDPAKTPWLKIPCKTDLS